MEAAWPYAPCLALRPTPQARPWTPSPALRPQTQREINLGFTSLVAVTSQPAALPKPTGRASPWLPSNEQSRGQCPR